jgi:hypothetical protein
MWQQIKWISAVLVGIAAPIAAMAQSAPPSMTIGDLSAAQRAVIDADIRRALMRVQAGSEAPMVPAPTSSAMVIPVASPAAAASSPRPFVQLEPRVAVTGVAKLRGDWLAEVVTDSGAYLLKSGQAVPQTAWRVNSVDGRQVTLVRDGERKGAKTLRSFAFTE